MKQANGRLRPALAMTNIDCSFRNLEDSIVEKEQGTGLGERLHFMDFKEANDCPVLPS